MAHGCVDVAGKAALVTGGNSGIARSFTEAIAQAGGDVFCRGTSADKNAAAPRGTTGSVGLTGSTGTIRGGPSDRAVS